MKPFTSAPSEMTIMVALPYNAYPAATISRPVTNPSSPFPSFCFGRKKKDWKGEKENGVDERENSRERKE